MELSNVNIQVKATTTQDIASSTSSSKDNESSFSKVYKDVSDKTNNVDSQTKVDTTNSKENSEDAKKDVASLNTSSENVAEKNVESGNNVSASTINTSVGKTATKDDKDLNKLIELLLMSGSASQNLINLLNSNAEVDTKEIKDVLSEILKSNLSTKTNNLDSKDEASTNEAKDVLSEILNGSLSTKNNTLNSNSQVSNDVSFDEVSKLLSVSNETLKEAVDKLATNIADKLNSDNSIKGNLLEKLVEKGNETTITAVNDATINDQIIKQLKKLTESSGSEVNSKAAATEVNSKVAATEVAQAPITSVDLPSDNKDLYLNNFSSNNVGADENNNKLASKDIIQVHNSSSKDDEILKQLIDKGSPKNSTNNFSDKIANVLNRFETLKVDNQPLADGKLSINKATFNEDFIKTVKFMDINNIKELSVKVIPKDLGEVVIRLSMDNGVMKANITATNKDTYNLLNSQLSAINNELTKQNMTIQNFSLSLYNGENFLFNGDGSRNDGGKQQGRNNIKVDGTEELDSQNELYSENNSSINILA